MNPVIQQQWIDALESGEYPKGKGCLIREENGSRTYCCLGVLSALAVKAGVIEEHDCSENTDNIVCLGNSSYLLSEKVSEWAGLDAINPMTVGGVDKISMHRVTLAHINDRTPDFSIVIEEIKKL